MYTLNKNKRGLGMFVEEVPTITCPVWNISVAFLKTKSHNKLSLLGL